MLSILLLLAAAPQSTLPAMPEHLITPIQRRGDATMRVMGQTSLGCPSELRLANALTAPGSGLMWREDGQAVGLYRLLDRHVGGCPAPIVVNYRVPGSNAVGREVGRLPRPRP